MYLVKSSPEQFASEHVNKNHHARCNLKYSPGPWSESLQPRALCTLFGVGLLSASLTKLKEAVKLICIKNVTVKKKKKLQTNLMLMQCQNIAFKVTPHSVCSHSYLSILFFWLLFSLLRDSFKSISTYHSSHIVRENHLLEDTEKWC